MEEGMAALPGAEPKGWAAYKPLVVVLGLIAAATAALAARDIIVDGAFGLRGAIARFMAGFFLVFAGFKLLDLRGFADGFFGYDLLARRVWAYGLAYPFVELAFGLSMLAGYDPDWLLWTEAGVMAFGAVGVAAALKKRKGMHCACLGAVVKLPLSKVAMIENLGMAGLAVVLVFL